jgi:hypothetical protein
LGPTAPNRFDELPYRPVVAFELLASLGNFQP